MQRSMRTSCVVLASFLTLTRVAVAQREPIRIYVDASAPAGGDGRAWQCAFSSLDLAIARAPWGAHLWVAAGTYKPVTRTDPIDPRSATFWIARDLKLFGGFAGTEQSFDERAGLFDATILDGDIGVPGDDSDNVDHVVKVSGPATAISGAIVIDGFTIQHGNARDSGGGIADYPALVSQPGEQGLWEAGNLLLRNCTVTKNKAALFGGGLQSVLARTDIAWCTFTDNEANAGGAIHPMSSPTHVYNSRFVANRAVSRGGAFDSETSFYSPDTGPTMWVVNSLFEANVAPRGAAVFLAGSQSSSASAVWSNCTITRNEGSTSGAGIEVKPSPSVLSQPHVFVYNTIVWGNVAPVGADLYVSQPPGTGPYFADVRVDHSIVGGGWPGENTSADPRIGPDGRLAPSSPAIDAGNNAYLFSDSIDLDQDAQIELLPFALGSSEREPRLRFDAHAHPGLAGFDPFGLGAIVDIGAHEFQPQLVRR